MSRWSTVLAAVGILAAGALSGIPAQAQGSIADEVFADGALSMAEAYALAAAGNPQYQLTLVERQQLAAARTGALGWESPELIYQEDGNSSERSESLEKRWTLRQDFPSVPAGFKRRSRYALELEAMDLAAEDTRRQLRARIKTAYAEVAYRARVVRLLEGQFRLARQAHEAVTLKFELGDVSRREYLQSQLNTVAMRNDLQEAEAAFDLARYGLFAEIGLLPADQEYGVAFPDTLAFVEVDFGQDESLEELDDQPRYLASVTRQQAAETALAAAKWRLFPDLSLSFYLQNYDGRGYDNHGFEIGARLPLWFMPEQSGQVASARAESARQQWRQRSVLLDMKREIEQAWHGYDASLAVIRALTGETLAQSQELLMLALEGYEAGEVGLIELIAAQHTYLDSQLRYQSALLEYNKRLFTLETYLAFELVTPVDPDGGAAGQGDR